MKGFTLIELLIVLTVLGLLFSFGFVNFRDYSRRQHLEGVATTLKGDLRLAQGKALSGEIPAGCLNLSGYDFRIRSANSYRLFANCDIDRVIKNVTLPVDITVSPNPTTITFKVLGNGTSLAEGTEVQIVLTQIQTGQTARVWVTSGGEIK